MVSNDKEFADKTFRITPRTGVLIMASIATICISATIWMFATFVTDAELADHHTATYVDVSSRVTALEKAFVFHKEEETLRQLERDVLDISDKRWEIRQRMEQPGGDTRSNKERDRELMLREKKYQGQIDCIKAGGNHCLSNGHRD